MPRAVNSFDVFDTLIARRCVEPTGALHQLEARTGLPGLAAARLNADRRLYARGQPFGLRDLWQEVRLALRLDPAPVGQLMELEIRIEHEEVVPVADKRPIRLPPKSLTPSSPLRPQACAGIRIGILRNTRLWHIVWIGVAPIIPASRVWALYPRSPRWPTASKDSGENSW
jgi:hypothetical protein